MSTITRLLLFTSLCCISAVVTAQHKISGTIKNHKDKVITSANITLKSADGKLLTFTRSNEKGNYELSLSAPAIPGSLIEVSSLGYKKEIIAVTGKKNTYDFILTEGTIDLPTVVINNRPRLKLNGDTLSYQLSDFSGKQDRVLADVLKKMPGIDVASDGKISYNGKNISNFYIDGDNLLDDKYNIATKSIPKEAVDKVQVIENDQPIKMLRNKSNSDDVALNITIKDEAKLKIMGQASIGAGLPERFNGNVNAMMFNKKYKGINYIKGNNIGDDPAADLISHNVSDYLKRLNNNKRNTLLSSGAAGVPDLPKNRYLFNQAGLINVNNLFNLHKDVQLKTNLYYLTDRQQRDYNKFTENYLPNGNISFTEQQHNISRPNQFRAQANLNINRDKSYLINNFIGAYNPVSYQVGLTTNDILLKQQLHQRTTDISNEFSYMNTLKSGSIYNLYSYVNYTNLPERLQISPGLNTQQFNGGLPYAQLDQSTQTPSWFTNNYFSFKLVNLPFIQTYKTGFSLEKQSLSSSLLVQENDLSYQPAVKDAINNLDWNRSNLFAEGLYEYETEQIKASIKLPVSYQQIHYSDPGFALDKRLSRLYLNPNLNVKYQTGIENYLMLNYSIQNQLGSMDDIYQGEILKNYRNLFSNSALLSEQRNQAVLLNFNYRKAITMFFFSLQAMYSRTNLNTISSSILTENLQQREVLPYNNNINSYSLNGNVSKYWFALRTTLSMGLTWSQSSSNQIQNSEFLTYKNINNGIKAGFQSKISKETALNYTINYTQTASKRQGGNESVQFNQIRQQAEFSFMPLKNVFLNLSAEHLYTKQSGQPRLSYIFSDLNMRYRLEKIRTDLEFGMNNLANIKNFKAIYLSANSFTSGNYRIPGRIGLFKATFNF